MTLFQSTGNDIIQVSGGDGGATELELNVLTHEQVQEQIWPTDDY